MAIYTNLILRTLNSPFVGHTPDFTRGSVLSHKDVDNNFIFLKGEDIITGSTSGTSIVLTQVNNDIIEIDILPILNFPDNFTTGSTLVGHTVVFDTKNSLSAYTVDLSPISGDTNTDNYTTGSTLIGSTIYYDRTDALSAFTTNLSGFTPASDYGNIIFVSEVGPTGLTRNNVIGNINIPVDINWASQIAQSGDTIHVKSGIYTSTTTGVDGLSVDGVNHYFEPGAKVYKTTTGAMFSKFSATAPFNFNNEANVYGSGSFYGSGSCGKIFYNFGGVIGITQTFEWDVCENSSDSCYYGSFNFTTILRGKSSIVSSGGDAIYNSPSDFYDFTVDCPEIRSTIGAGIIHLNAAGELGSLIVNATRIEGSTTTPGTFFTSGIGVSNHGIDDGFVINAGYVNHITTSGSFLSPLDLLLNVSNMDSVTIIGATSVKTNGSIGEYIHATFCVSDLGLCDRITANGAGTINATINGNYSPPTSTEEINAINGVTCNFKLQTNGNIATSSVLPYTENRQITGTNSILNLLGKWDIDGWNFSLTNSKLRIPIGTDINLGPTEPTVSNIGETFNLDNCDARINGTIVERTRNDGNGNPISGSTTLMTITGDTRLVYNGATIIVRDQNSQILTSPTGDTIGIYSAGLNTNKMNAFNAEQEKLKLDVAGTGAGVVVNGEVFTSTTGATAAASAAELVALINANGVVVATATQDIPGTDTYLYVEADVAGNALTMVYGANVLLDVVIRYNSNGATDTVGGTLIEDPDITSV